MKSEVNPIINLNGRDTRKSSSTYGEVRMDKNINMETEEETKPTASDIENTVKRFCLRRTGFPEELSNPPGMLKDAINNIMATSAVTNMDALAVSFIHLSPSSLKYLWESTNKARGVNPSEFFISLYEFGTIFSTSCHKNQIFLETVNTLIVM